MLFSYSGAPIGNYWQSPVPYRKITLFWTSYVMEGGTLKSFNKNIFGILHFLSFSQHSVTFSMHVLKHIFYSFSVFVWVVRVKFLSNAYDTLWRDANLCVLLFGGVLAPPWSEFEIRQQQCIFVSNRKVRNQSIGVLNIGSPKDTWKYFLCTYIRCT